MLKNKKTVKLALESLEDRLTPTSVSYWWTGTFSSDMSYYKNYVDINSSIPTSTDFDNNNKDLIFNNNQESFVSDPVLSSSLVVNSIQLTDFSSHQMTLNASLSILSTNNQTSLLYNGEIDVNSNLYICGAIGGSGKFEWSGGSILGTGDIYISNTSTLTVKSDADELGVDTYVGYDGSSLSDGYLKLDSTMNNNLTLTADIQIGGSSSLGYGKLEFSDTTGEGTSGGIDPNGSEVYITNYGTISLNGTSIYSNDYLYIGAEVDNYGTITQYSVEDVHFDGSTVAGYDLYNQGTFNTYDGNTQVTILVFTSGYYQAGSASKFNMKTHTIGVYGNMWLNDGEFNGLSYYGSTLYMEGTGMGDGDIYLTDVAVTLQIRDILGDYYYDQIILGDNSLYLSGTGNSLSLSTGSETHLPYTYTMFSYSYESGSWGSTSLKDWTYHQDGTHMYLD